MPEKEEGEDGREETAMSTTSRKRSASAPEYAKFVTGSDAFGKRKEKKKRDSLRPGPLIPSTLLFTP